MNRRIKRLALLGTGTYLLVLMLQVPAAWVLHWGRGAIPETVTWTGVEGSLWAPQVRRIYITLPQGGKVAVGPVRADVDLLQLVTGAPAAEIEAQILGGETRAQVRLYPTGSWEIPNWEGHLRLGYLERLDSRLAMAQARGKLLFRVTDLVGSSLPEQGRILAKLNGLELGWLDENGPLGSYSLEGQISGKGQLEGRVRPVETDQLGIEGKLEAGLRPPVASFQGRAWTEKGASGSVRDLLSLLGPVRQGEVRIDWEGHFR